LQDTLPERFANPIRLNDINPSAQKLLEICYQTAWKPWGRWAIDFDEKIDVAILS
jgi:hypothetical protein